MNICIIGTGYVGLVTGACFADKGNIVKCVDTDKAKVEMLQLGEIPFYEPELQSIVTKNCSKGCLTFTTSVYEGLRDASVCFITVGTPSLPDGSADIGPVLQAVDAIGGCMTDDMIIVIKSTVPIGTADMVRARIREQIASREKMISYEIVSNPEFLKEGSAVDDFINPDRIVIGADNSTAANTIAELYLPFVNNKVAILRMNNRSAEMTKYAANAMLATRISFMNEIARLCDELGADVEKVRQGIGADMRIGEHFLFAGPGYGGSCFPKDIRELIRCGHRNCVPMEVISAVERVNNLQKYYLVEMVKRRFGMKLTGKRLGIWGLSFKPHTDDMREAPSVQIIKALIECGASASVYDPVALYKAREILEGYNSHIQYATNMTEAVKEADALLIITDWPEFKKPAFQALKDIMTQRIIFDGRNMYDPEAVAALGFEYYCIGRGRHV